MNLKGIAQATLVTIPTIAIIVIAWIEYAGDSYWWIASVMATVFLVAIWLVFAGTMSRVDE